MEDALKALGLPSNASVDDASRAYRLLALAHHPDRSNDPCSPTIFQTIGEALQMVKAHDELLDDELLDADIESYLEAILPQQNAGSQHCATPTTTATTSAPASDPSSEDQTGLSTQPPHHSVRIHPAQPARPRRTLYAMPLGPEGHPIISDERTLWMMYAMGQPRNGYAKSFKGPSASDLALAHILAFFANEPPHPSHSGICPNCFLFHLGHPCSLPRPSVTPS